MIRPGRVVYNATSPECINDIAVEKRHGALVYDPDSVERAVGYSSNPRDVLQQGPRGDAHADRRARAA
jgi:hypothetical protein